MHWDWEQLTQDCELYCLLEMSKINEQILKNMNMSVFVCFRLYPVGITVQRHPVKDIILQNYHIPAGVSEHNAAHSYQFSLSHLPTAHSLLHQRSQVCWPSPQTMVQACLYPMGRSSLVFEEPLRFNPSRWSGSREGAAFRSLAFGFGPRQCVGRRIAENELQLLLMNVSWSRVGMSMTMKQGWEDGLVFRMEGEPDDLQTLLLLRPRWSFWLKGSRMIK